MIGFCSFIFVQACTIVALRARNGQVSITAGIPMTIPYAAFVTGFGLMVLAAIASAWSRYSNRAGQPDRASGR
jgi:TRAP-type C4-dicarboxylate transport system permease small subunit